MALPGATPDQKAAAHLECSGTYPTDQRAAARAELAKGLAVKEVSAPVRVDLLNRSAELYAREKKYEEYRNELARILTVKGVRAELSNSHYGRRTAGPAAPPYPERTEILRIETGRAGPPDPPGFIMRIAAPSWPGP